MLAVVFGVGTTALAAVPGDPFKLGRINTINRLTTLVGNVAGPTLVVDNNSNAANARALDLRGQPGKAPLTVNADAGKAANLDADRLDGTESYEFIRFFTRYVTRSSAEDSSGTKTVVASCPEGELALSGQANVVTQRAGQDAVDVPVALQSVGFAGGPRWSATARVTEHYDGTWALEVTAYCVDAPPELVPAGG